MKWKGRRQSSNVEDRRGRGGRGISPFLLGPLIRLLFSKTGLIIAGILLAIYFFTGYNPLSMIGGMIGLDPAPTENSAYQGSPEEEVLADFSATILADTEDVWGKLLDNYQDPDMVLFTGYVSSACGSTSSATGPFYCPGDQKIYLDLSFFDDMERRLNAPGDFAQAYVIAHEVGHHVQNLMGITDKMAELRNQVSETEYNQYSVRLELQADFFAGVWAYHSQQSAQMMEAGDLEEAMNAARAIGDDRLQKQSTGRVTPDSFTHGTSEQRMRWFMKGYQTGDVSQGDTFSAPSL